MTSDVAKEQGYSGPLPQPTTDSQPFWDGCNEGVLRIQQCQSCQSLRYPPGNRCPRCWSEEAQWVTSPGDGIVHAFTVMRRAYHPGLIREIPYVVAVVELAEGVRIITNIVGCQPEEVAVGMAVGAVFTELVPGVRVVKFMPRDGAIEQTETVDHG
jgi:uncharacterized OB-fold protein